jgi:ankyrin repeat protein
VGAVTFGSGTTGVSGIVSSANSLVGSVTDDLVGGNGVTALSIAALRGHPEVAELLKRAGAVR